MPCPIRGFRARCRISPRASLALALLLGTAPIAHAERALQPRFAAPEPAAPARAQSASSYDPLWTGFPLPTYSGTAVAMTVYDGGIVMAAGGSYFGASSARFLASWDGVKWNAIGEGVTKNMLALAVCNGELIAAGVGGFGASPGVGEQPAIFAWDGVSWKTIGSANGNVVAATVIGTDLYVCGTFLSIDGVAAARIARWDGATWYPVGAGFASGSTVRALVSHGGTLVAGGTIAAYQGIAQWNGATWSTLGAGLQNGASAGVVNSLASDGTTLYAGGSFTASGATPLTKVAAWNGSSWSSLAGATYASEALAIYGGWPMATVPYVGVNRPQLWNGSLWQPFNQPNVKPVTYAVDGATLYAAGNLSTPLADPTVPAINPFYRFDGATWTAIQEAWTPAHKGVGGLVYAAQEWKGELYVGGVFGHVGTGTNYLYSPGVVKWDGSNWTAIGAGGQHFDFTVWNDSLVASVDGFAKIWNGSTWRRLAATQSGSYTFDTFGNGLVVHQGDLYVLGPQYSNPGFVPLYGVGRWTGSDWVPVGGGMEDTAIPYAGVSWGSNLAVGGLFTTADGQPARNLAYWDGAAWHEIGGGVNNWVLALGTLGSDLVVGGTFTEAGGQAITGAARWDGAQWHAMGSRAVSINRLRLHGGKLYAAGTFLDDLAQPVGGAAVWNGTEWTLLGSGLDPYGVANNLDFVGDDLYLVGSFNQANGHPSRCIAKLANVSTLDVTPIAQVARLELAPTPNPARGAVRFSVTLPVAGRARLVIRDVAGREVARLLDGAHAAGAFTLAWEGRVAPGLYFATLEAAGERTTTRVARLR